MSSTTKFDHGDGCFTAFFPILHFMPCQELLSIFHAPTILPYQHARWASPEFAPLVRDRETSIIGNDIGAGFPTTAVFIIPSAMEKRLSQEIRLLFIAKICTFGNHQFFQTRRRSGGLAAHIVQWRRWWSNQMPLKPRYIGQLFQYPRCGPRIQEHCRDQHHKQVSQQNGQPAPWEIHLWQESDAIRLMVH